MQKLRAEHHAKTERTLREIVAHLKFIDESGAHLGLTRLYGRAKPGARVREATPGFSGKHYTVIAALGLAEISATWLLEEAMTREAFDLYVSQVLAPTLRPGDLILIDNLNVHKSETARQVVTAHGARLEFLPPYSPDLNPIELCWAKVKTVLRKLKARSLDELIEALNCAFSTITPDDIRGWFTHCGYITP